MEKYDVIIIGAGSAGFTAGIYSTRFGLRSLIIGKEPGGQANEAFEIDNWPGQFRIGGMELMKKFRQQAENLGAAFVSAEAVDVVKKGKGFIVKTRDKEYESRSLIIAMGARKRKLGIAGEEKFRGKGIAYCATCDAFFFKDKVTAMIGGGNSAVKGALLLTEHAKKVYLVYRRGKKDMRAMAFWIKKLEKNKKVEMIFNSAPREIRGKDRLESVVFEKDGKEFALDLDGLFIEIGTIPETGLAEKLGVYLADNGKIKVNGDMSTNVEGVFAAGDITDGSNEMEQIVTAASEGAIAAESAYRHVNK